MLERIIALLTNASEETLGVAEIHESCCVLVGTEINVTCSFLVVSCDAER